MIGRKALFVAVSAILALMAIPAQASDFEFADPAMGRVWERYDKPISEGVVADRSWMWGPGPITRGIREPYAESRLRYRIGQYYDKIRMEINRTDVTDPDNPWYVTNGLLTVELITGRIQVGNTSFLERGCGADIPVAGDPGNTWPTYRGLAGRINTSGMGAPNRTGEYATEVLKPDGTTFPYPGGNDPGAQLVYYEGNLGHNIPRAFWEFMNSRGLVYSDGSYVPASPWFDWVFVMGWPIGEPYWALVKVGGEDRWVLFQPYERRVLTYTPSNPDPWKVEMGNIGQHYYRWRYEAVGAPCPGREPTPAPGARTEFGDGGFWVGIDIAPGTYRNRGSSEDCYWERVKHLNVDTLHPREIISWGGKGPQVVSIGPFDSYFVTRRCGQWTRDLSPITSSPTAPFGDGAYIVGVDIAPGRWRSSSSSETCWWERLGGFGGTRDERIGRHLGKGPAVVDISPSDVGFRSRGCGQWTRVED